SRSGTEVTGSLLFVVQDIRSNYSSGIFWHGYCKTAILTQLQQMNKFLTLVAFLGFMGAANAQTDVAEPVKAEPVKEAAVEAVEPVKEAAVNAVEATTEETNEAVKGEAKTAACCAGKAKGAKCDHAKAEAGDGHGHAEAGHDHGTMKAHVCTDACKGEAHAYACGEEGHKCAADCHAKK
ncbi:MAG: hypothetical protein WAR83_14805, partial [Flavobacteriales bacterium]